jgi:DNA polymerase
VLEHSVPSQIQCSGRDDAAHVLFRDYETRGVLALDKVGVERYAADPQTEIVCCAFAVDDQPVKLWKLGDPIPVEFPEAAFNPNWCAVAHNARFEITIEERNLGPRYGWPQIPLERQRCTLAMASALAMPGRLEKLADVLELSHRKDVAGHRLMLAMSKPRRARKGENPNQVHWFDDPERLQRLHAYSMIDIEVLRELYLHLPALPPSEQAIWCLDATVNARGFYLDQRLASAATKIAAAAAPKIDMELTEVTGGAVTGVNQIKRFQAWLRTQGCILDSLDKEAVAKFLKNEPSPQVQRALELRQDGGQAAVKKIVALLDRVGSGGRVRGSFIYHKASTGRWAGTGPQPQNLKRPEIEDIEAAITAVATGDYDHVRNLYPRVLSVLGDLSRSLVCSAPGYILIGADFGAIESRVLAWVAAEEWKLEAYRRYDATRDPRDEPYCVLAARMLHLPEGSITGGRERKRATWRAAIKAAKRPSKSSRRACSAWPSGKRSRANGELHIRLFERSGTQSIMLPGLRCNSAAVS